MGKSKTITTIVNARRVKGGVALTLILAGGARETVRVNRNGDSLTDYHGQISGYGAKGARLIREEAAQYFEAFDALDAEARAKQLLAEADAYCDRCHLRVRKAIVTTAIELDNNPDPRGGLDVERVERAVKRDDEAYAAQTVLYDHLCLLFGEHLRDKWERERRFAETLAEAKRMQAAEKGGG